MAFLLDTVTVSELRKGTRTNPAVLAWQESEVAAPAYLSVITMNEIRYGILKQKRRDPKFAELLEVWYASLVSQPVVFPLLGVDLPISELAADFRGNEGLSYADSLIAATAKVHSLTLATRNTADFAATGIALFNPWDFEA
jgi:predicted nucleic acid-binding protein